MTPRDLVAASASVPGGFALCDHGYFLHDCALCHKRSDECDYGSCTAPSVRVIVGKHEGRRTCAAHAEHIARTVAS